MGLSTHTAMRVSGAVEFKQRGGRCDQCCGKSQERQQPAQPSLGSAFLSGSYEFAGGDAGLHISMGLCHPVEFVVLVHGHDCLTVRDQL